jgi:hypothetical protein
MSADWRIAKLNWQITAKLTRVMRSAFVLEGYTNEGATRIFACIEQ